MRIAAIGDLHAKSDSAPRWKRAFGGFSDRADALLLAGDLTDHGRADEARALAEGLAELSIPVLAVLGNHDYEHGTPEEVCDVLGRAGVRILDGDSCVVDGVGFAGVTGFAGGFPPHALGAWGEPAIKAFTAHAEREASKLVEALSTLPTRQRVALLHYAPVRTTLEGEAPEIYPFLGSSRLGDALEAGRATVACHGHAHFGVREGATRSGIPVFNVAAPVLGPGDPARLPLRLIEIDSTRTTVHAFLDRPDAPESAADRRQVYRDALRVLRNARIPYLVGGGVAMEHLTGIARDFHDLDLFVRPRDVNAALRALAAKDFDTSLAAPHWLGKVFGANGVVIDLIFNSGNGACAVDDLWFDHAIPGELLGETVSFSPVEELLWMKAFVMERERYDGADVTHLIRACGDEIDWRRLLWRFGTHWRVLLSHLILYDFVYPGPQEGPPQGALRLLIGRLRRELEEGGSRAAPNVCRGGLLSRAQYLADFERGYLDVREAPLGPLAPEEIDEWTRAIEGEPEADPTSDARRER